MLLCLGLAAPFFGQGAVAQEENPAGIEEIVVTGSRIPRSDLSSISPISVLNEEDLEAAGNATLENFLQNLPAVGGADFGSSANNGNPGLATVSLRGLGPNRTLVLLNGHRPAPYGTGGLVDLNLIPTAMIDRIEVLRDGASTIYGSDAIAGVVNVITKRDFSGIDLDFGYDSTTEWDGDQHNLALTLGQAGERGHWVLNGQWTKREEIGQGDRGFSACPLRETGTPRMLTCGGSGTAYPARIAVGDDAYVVDSETGQVRAFEAADGYNFAAVSYMVTPQEVFSLYGDARYNLAESGWSSASVFLRGNFANRSSDQLLAPVGTFWAPQISRLHPNNPFGNALCASTAQCSSPQDVVVTRRLAETGGRGFTQSATSWQLIAGLDGEFANGWRWDVSFDYAKFDDGQRDPGRAVQPRLVLLLTPDDPGTTEMEGCAGDPDCAEAAGSAGVWNPFARDTLTSAMQSYGTVAPNEIHRSVLQVFQFNLQGDLGGFELPGGPVQWAFGYEKRREQSAVLPDAGALLDQIYFVSGEETRGAYGVEELYGEIRLPLVADAAWAKALTLELSARRSDYTTIGTGTTFKFALEYAPNESLRFRVVSSDGFRAPNIAELFAPQQLTAATYTDPCLNWGMNADPVIQANCEAEGLPRDFSLSSNQATGIQGGNPNLKEETADSLTVGVVFTPSFLPNLSVALDWYNIEIEDAIGTAGTNNIISGCWSSPGFSSPLCALIDPRGAAAVGASRRTLPAGATAPNYRDALNTVAGQLLTQANLASFDTDGVDFSIRYGWDLSVGRLDLSLTGTYLLGYAYTAFEGSGVRELAGKFGTDPYQGDNSAAFPDIQANLRIGLTRDNWNIAWTARFMSEVDDINASASNLANSADAIWYHDLQANYEWRNIVLTLGMRNMLDEDPPYVTNNDDMNTINYSYDTAGRYLYTRLNFRY